MKERFEYAGSKSVSEAFAGPTWAIYEHYEIERQTDGVFICAPRHLPPSGPQRIGVRPPDDVGKRYYSPLRAYPDLFLRFAAISRKSPLTHGEMLEVVLDWASNYGVLGLDGIDYLKAEGYQERRTGRRESVSAFSYEVRSAARVLELYEAATVQEEPDERLTRVLEGWHFSTEGLSLNEQREKALRFVSDRVGAYVSSECYPILYRTVDKEANKTLGFAHSFGFYSLLGAMYLQMMWLLTEGSNVRRCGRPGCPRIIEFQPPQLPEDWTKKGARGKYRTRKDTKYCSQTCKQWVYDQTKKKAR